jgi:hypothetical protein
MPLRWTLLLACSVACSGDGGAPDGDDDDDDVPGETDEPNGQCGDVTTWDVTVTGRVRAPGGGAAAGATVRIEDRVWDAGKVYGTATTDAMGAFTILAEDLVSVEDCWGMLGYYAVAERDDTSGEAGINSALFSAIDTGSLTADISAVPIDLEEPPTP